MSVLFLTSGSRCHKICYLDIRYMVKTVSSCKFHFSKLTKSWKKGKASPCLELRAYPKDRYSCVMTYLEEYLKRSTSWREKEQSQLLLSHFKPYKEIQKSTHTGWVKSVLRNAGIDTSQFKVNWCRSAATSKAKEMSISLEGVLKRRQCSGEWTWQKHYYKPIQRNATFQTAVLSSTKALETKSERESGFHDYRD